MRTKYKLVIHEWLLSYVDDMVKKYNEEHVIYIDREEMLERCINKGIDTYIDSTLNIRTFKVEGNQLPLAFLEELLTYLRKIENSIYDLYNEELYEGCRPLQVLQASKNTVNQLIDRKKNNIHTPLVKVPFLKLSLKPKKLKLYLSFSTCEKIKWFLDDTMRGLMLKEKVITFEDHVEAMILDQYEKFINEEYYAEIKIPAYELMTDELTELQQIIRKHIKKCGAELDKQEAAKMLERFEEEINRALDINAQFETLEEGESKPKLKLVWVNDQISTSTHSMSDDQK